MNKNIFIILPYKESLDPNHAGAVSLYVKDTTKFSKYKKNISIISSDNFDNNSELFRNKNYIKNFCEIYKSTSINLIEIHNRPEYLPYIKKNFPDTKINLIFHNDPLSLRGSISSKERDYIIKNCDKIIFISRWIQHRFFKGIKNANYLSTLIVPHGVDKKTKSKTTIKNKNILFVGKLNHAKGYHIFCDTASKFKKIDPTWKFIAIGNESRKNIFPNKNIVKEVGYKKNSEVLNYYSKSEIAIGNSVWDEPLGRIAIEASSRKCLPIISNKGGLAESKKFAIVLKHNTSSELVKILQNFTKKKLLLRKKQMLFYKNNNFDIRNISKKLDDIRSSVLISKNDTLNKEKNRILHVANFNENSDGRLFYSFSNKLNNGFIKSGNIVETISDRLFLKSNRSFMKPFNDTKKFNDKILNTLKNFSPHILIIGHVFNIDGKIFSYCKENNIKICSWYIDSISEEFLNETTRINFFRNLDLVDYCFVTSSPKIFIKNKNFKKLRFIPNPVDAAIDNYKNFNNNDIEYDMFVAISHGQNRGLLKKGKFDEREKLINNIFLNIPELKYAKFGLNGFEPIWGSNYYYYLSKSKMALNISRGKYQNVYSSDRISSLIGNGLLVFINKKTNFSKIFSNKEVVFYKNQNDLLSKIKYFAINDAKRKKIAKSGHKKYHDYMNNIIVSDYILSCVKLKNMKKPFWFNI
jgi:hypothetical protein